MALKQCECCGTFFTGKALWCSDECHDRWVEKQTRTEPPKDDKPKLSRFDIDRLARAEGLSYGQYVAKYHV